MKYKAGDLVVIKTINEMIALVGTHTVSCQTVIGEQIYGICHNTAPGQWGLREEINILTYSQKRIVMIHGLGNGHIYRASPVPNCGWTHYFAIADWMIAGSADQSEVGKDDQAKVVIPHSETLSPAATEDLFEQINDRINNFEEAYRQADRMMREMRTRVSNVEITAINCWKKQQDLEEKVALLNRTIERIADIRW